MLYLFRFIESMKFIILFCSIRIGGDKDIRFITSLCRAQKNLFWGEKIMKEKVIVLIVLFLCCPFITTAQEPLDVETLNILAGGKVIASGFWNTPQYIYEGDFDAADFLTRNGEIQDPAYVGVLRNRRMTIESFYLFGGRVYEDGGWFDSTDGPPMIQIMANPGDDWTDVEPIADYPTLDGTNMEAANNSETGHADRMFPMQTFDPPLSCVGIRVIGKGSSGNNPDQSFVAIGQLRALGTLGESVNTFDPPPMDGALPTGSNFWHPNEHGGSPFGDVIIDENLETVVMCQEQVAAEFELPEFDLFPVAFFGFYSANPLTLESVSFQHGSLQAPAGWINTEGGANPPLVQIRSAPGEPWENAGTIDDYPDTFFGAFRNEVAEDIDQRVYTFEFDSPTEAIGVRVVGFGSFENDGDTPFIQVSELSIEGSGSPRYTGPIGTGQNNDGEPFQPNADAEIFIEAERARSINESYTIFGHGAADNGLVTRVNFGPRFGEWSRQEMQFDIEITEAGLYSVFAKQDTLSGWADSYYITFDEQNPFGPESPFTNAFLDSSNDLRWQPSQGDPAGSPEIFLRELISLDGGVDFWELDAGVHTFRMACREPLGILDWILITQDFEQDITQFEPPETEPPVGIHDFMIY